MKSRFVSTLQYYRILFSLWLSFKLVVLKFFRHVPLNFFVYTDLLLLIIFQANFFLHKKIRHKSIKLSENVNKIDVLFSITIRNAKKFKQFSTPYNFLNCAECFCLWSINASNCGFVFERARRLLSSTFNRL